MIQRALRPLWLRGACSSALVSFLIWCGCRRHLEQPHELIGKIGFVGIHVVDVEASRARTHQAPRLRHRLRRSRERERYGLTVLLSADHVPRGRHPDCWAPITAPRLTAG